MALIDKIYSGEGIYASDFLNATPEERYEYLTNNQYTARGVPPHIAAGHALRNVTQGPYDNSAMTPDQLGQALSGIDPALAQAAASQLGGLVTQQQQHNGANGVLGAVNSVMNPATEFLSKYQDMFVPAVGTALFAGAGAFGGLGGAEVGLESASGGGSTMAAAEGIGGVGGSGLTAAEMAALEAQAAGDIATGGILGGGGSGTATFGNHLSSLFNGGSSLSSFMQNAPGISGLTSGIQSLFGDNASGGGTFGGGSGVDWAAKAAGAVPVLAAINYAKNQGPFDTSRLEDTYNQFQPDALAYEYDQNTARGRNDLTSSLTNRGVMGSSFGNMDMTNFQTSRDLGRRSLVNQGLAARGGLASSILDTQIKERGLKNDLYGRSLLALGNIFGGRN